MDPITTQVTLGAAGAGGVEDYWIATYTGGYGRGVDIDSDGNVYTTGNFSESGENRIWITKHDASGVIQWQRRLTGLSNESDTVSDLAVDSSGNVYIAGFTKSYGAGDTDVYLAKYNTSGVIQWQRSLGSTGDDRSFSVATDSSGNAYVTGYDLVGTGSRDVITAKYNSSGTLQWQRNLQGINPNNVSDEGHGIAVDSSSNIYVAGYHRDRTTSTYHNGLLIKYNSSGTIQWQRSLTTSGLLEEQFLAVATDSSGNVYVTGFTGGTGAGNEDILTAKYNSSGTLQWQRILGDIQNDNGFGIGVDGSSNVYVLGIYREPSTNNRFLIAKYNSSGTIQWQRQLTTSSSDTPDAIAVDNAGNVYVVGGTGSTGIIAKLPGDGSLTGTYGSFTYSSASLTSATSSLSSFTPSISDFAASLTSSSASLTDAAASFTSSTTTL